MTRRLPAALLGIVGMLLGLGLLVFPANRAVVPAVNTVMSSVGSSTAAGSTHHAVVDRQAERLLAPVRKGSRTGPLMVAPGTPVLTAPHAKRIARAPPLQTGPRLSTPQRPTGRSPPAPAGT